MCHERGGGYNKRSSSLSALSGGGSWNLTCEGVRGAGGGDGVEEGARTAGGSTPADSHTFSSPVPGVERTNCGTDSILWLVLVPDT